MRQPTLYSPKDFAAFSGWPERRIRNLVANKKLKHLRIGANILIPETAIDEFIESNMIEPK